MRNFLIKLLGGYTETEYYKQVNLLAYTQHEFKHVLWVIAHQQEKLKGALISFFALYKNSPETCYDLSEHYTKAIVERTNREVS